MATKSVTATTVSERDMKYLAEIDDCLEEIATIRRDMKKTDAEIRRLEASSRRKLEHLRANLHAEKAS